MVSISRRLPREVSDLDSAGPLPVRSVTADAVKPLGDAMTRPTDSLPDVDDQPEGQSLGDRAAFALLEFREGRQHALSDLVREASPLLWHTVRAQGVAYQEADDVVQHTWAALVKHAHSISEPHAVLKWLLVTARRAAWESVRKSRDDAKRRADLPDDSPDHPASLPSADPLPDTHVIRDEQDRLVWASLKRLPERCQELLHLVSLADRPDYRAISAAIGMPMGSIGSTRGRCLAKLRTILDEQGDFSWTT